ncbi:MAG: tetratricopeptide repeat protein [Acidobacteriota bacterium]
MTDNATATYSLRRAQDMLGMSRGVIDGLVKAGFISPTRGPRNEWRFSFRDLMLLRTARELRKAKVPGRRIMRSLASLRDSLPEEVPLTGLRITAIGAEVAVRDPGRGPWDAQSGQMLMDFEVAPVHDGIAFLKPEPASDADPKAWLERGESLEGLDANAAEAAYRAALDLAPDYCDALLNLGALLCDRHRCGEAVSLYQQALERCPQSPLLHFNHAIALEDQGEHRLALASYERCLSLDPDLADAHFNAARLYEQLGDPQMALRHFSAYKRLQRD